MKPNAGLSQGSHRWAPEDINFSLQELRREFPASAGHRIFQAVEAATRTARATGGRAFLLQDARERLRAGR